MSAEHSIGAAAAGQNGVVALVAKHQVGTGIDDELDDAIIADTADDRIIPGRETAEVQIVAAVAEDDVVSTSGG